MIGSVSDEVTQWRAGSLVIMTPLYWCINSEL